MRTFLALLAVLMPGSAWACQCLSAPASGRVLGAYLGITFLLSFLPIFALVAAIGYLKRLEKSTPGS